MYSGRREGTENKGQGEGHCTVGEERAQVIRDRGRGIVRWRMKGHRELGTGRGALNSGGKEGTEN